MRESFDGLVAAGYTPIRCRESLFEIPPEGVLWGRMIFIDANGGEHGLMVEEDEYQPGDGNWHYYADKDGKVEKLRLKKDAQDHFYPEPKRIHGGADSIRYWLRPPVSE